MKTYIASQQESIAAAAEHIGRVVKEKPAAVLAFSAGRTMEPLFTEWAARCKNGELRLADCRVFSVTAYAGVPESLSGRRGLETLLQGTDLREENCCFLSEENLEHYDDSIAAAGGLDLAVLGLGVNAHIGFNEPDHLFYRKTHVVDLTESTIEANKRFFEDVSMVPRQAITMGIGTIMQAKKIVMIANGEGKAGIIKEAFSKEINPLIPASILQLHPDFTLIADDAALSLMNV